MTHADVVAFFGTAREAASKLGITESAVAQWKIRGSIPAGTQAMIQIATRGRLRADGAPRK